MSEVTSSGNLESFSYDNKIVRNFAIATMVWGLVGMLVGLIVAIQLYIPASGQGCQNPI